MWMFIQPLLMMNMFYPLFRIDTLFNHVQKYTPQIAG